MSKTTTAFKYFKYIPFILISLINISYSAVNTQAEVGNIEGDVAVEQGNLRYSVPLATPSGLNGIEPSLSISYKQGG